MINNISFSNPQNVYSKNSIQFTGKPENKNKEKSFVVKGSQTDAKVFTSAVDYRTYDQIKAICNHPAFYQKPIRIMPDVHPSKGTLVGFSAPVDYEKIIPGIIGGDIGCGMLCVKLDTQGQEIDYKKLDDVIRTYVSSGRTRTPNSMSKISSKLSRQIKDICADMKFTSSDFQESRLATLGGGNHFIEIDSDTNGQKYLIIHTGSRNFGKQIAQKHQFNARQQNHYFIKELSYLSGDEAKKYLQDMKIALQYAETNRRLIADEILYRMGWKEKDSFECVHNYISDDGMIRKSAISSKDGEKLLIPLNMRDGSILATGKGNPDWNETAPHGAGRKVRRGETQQVLSYKDFVSSMNGIYSTCVRPDTLDEAPDAYKDSDEIIENIDGTANVDEVIKPVYNFKE